MFQHSDQQQQQSVHETLVQSSRLGLADQNIVYKINLQSWKINDL